MKKIGLFANILSTYLLQRFFEGLNHQPEGSFDNYGKLILQISDCFLFRKNVAGSCEAVKEEIWNFWLIRQ